MIFSDETDKLLPALFAVQSEVSGVKKDGKNPHYKSNYATLEAVLLALKPALHEHGLLLMQAPAICENGSLGLVTTVLHVESGQNVEIYSTVPLPKNDPQGAGSAITYLSRYTISRLFSLPSLDDDAESAVATTDDLIKEMKKTSCPTELNQWGIDNADAIQGARGNKAELKRQYKAHMDWLKQAQEGCTDE